ncbi:Hypothetical predicted protein [Lecanosticta acicola]|uniref:Uncharacterized protein n=1 Tax=Lecanosticta acicola TaxID=111012 RepID=A0AAI8YYF3_9PEZI|nr:Hypothetical predicted protein [Lecanosticta acicola]
MSNHDSAPKQDASKSSRQTGATQSSSPSSRVPFSKRQIKTAPKLSSRETRRGDFLRKVKEGRDDMRFEARGEDILRADWERERRKWEESLSQTAPILDEEVDEEAELPGWMDLGSDEVDEDEAEKLAREEDRELKALLEHMPDDDDAMEDDGEEQSLWSDDADYDALFSEVLSQQEQKQGQQSVSAPSYAMHIQSGQQAQFHGEEMDMS